VFLFPNNFEANTLVLLHIIKSFFFNKSGKSKNFLSLNLFLFIKSNFELSLGEIGFCAIKLEGNSKSKSSNYLPKIDLNANANRRTSKQYTFDGVDSNIDLPFTIPTETENRIYSIQFSMPLFTSGLNNSQRRQALLQEVKSEEQLILVERGIVQQIRTLHTALRTSELNIASLKSAVESSKDALEATKLGYELNSRNLIDLLQAEKNYSESINNLSQATYGFIVTSLQYKQAIGNLVPGDVVELNKQFK